MENFTFVNRINGKKSIILKKFYAPIKERKKGKNMIDKIVDIIKNIFLFTIKNLKRKFNLYSCEISSLPINTQWVFNKIPYKIKIDITNNLEKSFFISNIKIKINKYNFQLKEFVPILNSKPRKNLTNIAIQSKESKTIYGIMEIGCGIDFNKLNNPKQKLIISIKNKKIKYKISILELLTENQIPF